jgi:hypothetical protein
MHRKAQPAADVLYACGGWAIGVIGEDGVTIGDGIQIAMSIVYGQKSIRWSAASD